MKFITKENKIVILGKEDFNPVHILECGQIFSYVKNNSGFDVFSGRNRAKILETEAGYEIVTKTPKYFENFFDLNTDYGKIKAELVKFPILKEAVAFGYGIRILKQDIFETLISFIISANNNIKRIMFTLNRIKEECGEGTVFPAVESLKRLETNDFTRLGCGYRAAYLYKVLRQLDSFNLYEAGKLPTAELRNSLLTLCGVGPKVADCILLFGYSRTDVFPVDTWINKVYNDNFSPENNRALIRESLLKEFGPLAGYAQQYLFYYKREYDRRLK